MKSLPVLLLLLTACGVGSMPGDTSGGDGDSTESNAALEAATQAAVEAGVVGAVVAIRVGDERAVSAAGVADVSTEAAMTSDHSFRVASNSKSMIGAVFAQLADEGAIELDSLAAPHLPDELTNQIANAKLVTIRQLLTHQSGIPEFFDDELWERALANPSRGLSTEEALAHIYGLPAEFAPGSGWYYSNSNYLLAGMILDKLSGGAHHAGELRERLFETIPMASAYYEEHEPATGELARGYEDVDGSADREDVTDLNIGMGLAAGAVVSTIPDLADYAHALGTSLFAAGASREMYRAVDDGEGGFYGLGIGVEKEPSAYTHSGELPGFYTAMIVFPDDDAAVAIGVNVVDSELDGAVSALFDAAISAVVGN